MDTFPGKHDLGLPALELWIRSPARHPFFREDGESAGQGIASGTEVHAVKRPPGSQCSFRFGRDTFAYANELVWEYRFDPVTGQSTTVRQHPPPAYAHRCFVMARSVRQFYYHASFDPTQPVADADCYRGLIRDVVSRSPRRPSPPGARIVVPGYDCLHAFSRAQEALLKAGCGGAWQSYVLRSHWRMVFPVSRRLQERMAARLTDALQQRPLPVVHLFRFPQLTINHGIVLFDVAETEQGLQFVAYDPNVPDHPTSLRYDRASRTFLFPRNHYWPGGRVDVRETYCGWWA